MATNHDLSDTAVYVGLTALGINVGIHAAMTPDHLAEMTYIGVLFIIGNVLVFAAMLLLYHPRTRQSGWVLGGLVCAGEIAAFILSRTTGLPNGYHESWAATTEDKLGLACVVVEALFVAIAAVRLPRLTSFSRRDVRRPLADQRTA